MKVVMVYEWSDGERDALEFNSYSEMDEWYKNREDTGYYVDVYRVDE